jgi:hypothetical protein
LKHSQFKPPIIIYGCIFLHKNKTLSIIELQLNYAIMNEFNSQPKTETQIGEPKILPTLEEQTILQQPEQLTGNDNVETGHELTNPAEMQTATATIEEVREVVQEIPIVEAPQAPAVESMQVDQVTDTTVIPEKKKMNIFVKAAIIGSAAAGTVLGGLGLSGGFSGKKSEMGKMQEGPKTEQTTSIFDVGKVNPDGSVVTAIANEPSIYNAPKSEENTTKSRMDGAVMPDVPKLGETEVDEATKRQEMRKLMAQGMSFGEAEKKFNEMNNIDAVVHTNISESFIRSTMAQNPSWSRQQAVDFLNVEQEKIDKAQAQARAMESEQSGVQVRDAVGEEVQMIESLYGMGNKLENTELAGMFQRPLPGAKLRIFFNFEKGQNFQNMKNIRIDQLRKVRNGSLDVETKGLIQGMSQQEFDKTINEIQNAPMQDINQSEYSISMKTNNGPRRINFGGKTKGVIEIDLNTDINAVGYWRNGSPEFTKEFVH